MSKKQKTNPSCVSCGIRDVETKGDNCSQVCIDYSLFAKSKESMEEFIRRMIQTNSKKLSLWEHDQVERILE